MFLFQFFVVAALFFLLAPGVLVTLKGSKYFIAAIHAILFTFIISMIYMLFWMPNQHWSSLLLLRNSEEEFDQILFITIQYSTYCLYFLHNIYKGSPYVSCK